MPVLLVFCYTCELDLTASSDALALFIHLFLGLGMMCFDKKPMLQSLDLGYNPQVGYNWGYGHDRNFM